jgi:hypothetical protein
MAQPEIGAILHGAVDALLLTCVEMGKEFGEVVGQLRGYGHRRRMIGGVKEKRIDRLGPAGR